VTKIGRDPQTIGGEAPNCRKSSLGKGKTARKVGRGGEVGHKPVPKPSELRGGIERLTIKGHWGRSAGIGGVPLHGGTLVDELCLGIREVNMSRMGNCSQTAEHTLWGPGVRAVRVGRSSDGEIVHEGENQAMGNGDMEGRDVNNKNQGGDRGTLGGAHWDWGENWRGTLE